MNELMNSKRIFNGCVKRLDVQLYKRWFLEIQTVTFITNTKDFLYKCSVQSTSMWVRKSIFLLTLVSLLTASPNRSSSNCPRQCNCQANDSIVTCPGKTTLKDERLVQNQQSVGMPATSLSSLQILQIYHFLISRCFQTLQNFV